MKVWLKWSKNGVWWVTDRTGYRTHLWFSMCTCNDAVEGSTAWFFQVNIWKLMLVVGFRG